MPATKTADISDQTGNSFGLNVEAHERGSGSGRPAVVESAGHDDDAALGECLVQPIPTSAAPGRPAASLMDVTVAVPSPAARN
jgi:hypothetical protein